MKKLIQKFLVRVFLSVIRNIEWSKRKSVGARTIVELHTTDRQITLIVWDLTNPKWNVLYSREELIDMLTVVRHCERELGWNVPEPPMAL